MSEASYPCDWSHHRLAEVAAVQTGLAKGKKNIEKAVRRPYLRVANVQAEHLDLREVKTIRVSADDIPRYSLEHGDVLLTEGGDFDKLGRGAMWRGEVPGCLHQNHLFAVRTDRDVLLPEYLVWLTNSPQGRRYFLQCSKQSTNLASINSTQLKRYPLVLPPLREQKAIADVLRTWDHVLDCTKRLIKAKRRLKRDLMQQLLTGKRRFGEFEGQPWRAYPIGDLLKEVSRPVTWDENELYELISIRRRSGGLFRRGRRHGYEIRTKKLCRVRAGDFLISKMQVVHGALGLVTPEFDGMKVSGSYITLVPKEAGVLDIGFFDYLTRLPEMYHAVLLSSYGVHIEKMTFNLDLYFKTVIHIPPTLEEQQRIVAVFKTADREIAALKEEMQNLTEQKQGLMQKLLTGQVRVQV